MDFGIVHHRSLGHLQFKQAGLQPAGSQRPGYRLDKARLAKLHRRNVDRDNHLRQAGVAPGLRLAASFTEHPVPQPVDHPGFFGHLNEAVRHDDAKFRMPPTNQCFNTDDQSALQADQRLVIQREFIQAKRPPQIALDQQTLQHRRVHCAGVELKGVTPLFLGLVHRCIGVLEQGFGILSVLRVKADAQRGCHGQLVPTDKKGLIADFNQTPGDLGGRTGMGRRQRKDEFIATQAGQGIDPPDHGRQTLGHRAKQFIAQAVPQGIVDPLEVVEIEKNQRRGPLLALGDGKQLDHPVGQQTAVRQASQRIEISQFPRLSFSFALG